MNEDAVAKRNIAFVSAICNHFSLDKNHLLNDSLKGQELKSLFLQISKSINGFSKDKDQVMKWVEFAGNFPVEGERCHETLRGLDEDLSQKSVILGDGLRPSEADMIVFSAVHYSMRNLPNSEMQKFRNILRWMDYIQNKEDFAGQFEAITLETTAFKSIAPENGDSLKKEPNGKRNAESSKKSSQGAKNAENSGAELKKSEAQKKIAGDGNEMTEKKKVPEKVISEKDSEINVTALNIQVGLIRRAWKHPSADSLLVEEIDIGNGNVRQVVSGLAKYCTTEELTNRRVALITNVKPGKLRDIMSSGLVLCASSEDHSKVEPLLPPEGAAIGECISFSGFEGKPEDVLNPKKKQLEKITPHLYTDDKGIATYKGTPFMTSAGPCTSSLPNASIK